MDSNKADTRIIVGNVALQVLDYLKGPVMKGRTAGHLMQVCGLRDGARTPDGLPESRVLDRALQKLRRNGKIKYVGREWFIVPE